MENLDIKALEAIEKSKPAQLGEVRTWGGKEYIKTPKGWRPKPKGFKEGEKKETTPKGNPVMKPEKVTPKNVTDKLKVGDHVMYNGKEMILTRISKDGRFQNGIEMKFAKEGETTPTGSKTKVGNMMYATPIKEEKKETPFEEFPEKIAVGEEAKVKVNGKEYTVKHQYNDDDKYGRYVIFENGKQVMISDYGAGWKFHGYDFDKYYQAYEGVKRYLKTGKLKDR